LEQGVDVDENRKITAQDVRHQEFSAKMRGYDKAEVEEYLSIVADVLEKEASEKAELKERIALLQKQLDNFRNLEDTLKNTLIRTQESLDDAKKTAEREGELIIREAQVKADRMIKERREKLNKLETNFELLRSKWNEYFVKFRSLLNSHLEILDKMQGDYENINRESIEIPEIEKELSAEKGEFEE
jgi:cell division initiation protein